MADKTCKYVGCDEPVNSPHDEEYCVFHAPIDKKGKTVERFNERIFKKIDEITEYNKDKADKEKKAYDFTGYKFPGDISFKDIEFSGEVDFRNAQFSGEVYFRNAQFSGWANFWEAQFSGRADFGGVRFLGNSRFHRAQFSEMAVFINAHFSGEADFNVAQFSGDAFFEAAQFPGDAYFFDAQFSGDVYFIDTQIGNVLDFSFVSLDEKSIFYFQRPQFLKDNSSDSKNIRIIFDKVRFNPFAAYFENIIEDNKNEKDKNNREVFLIFRYCQLKDVYFANNTMSMFSFYKSSYDQARFISSRWSHEPDKVLVLPFKRKNTIPEEKFLEEINELKNKKNDSDAEKLKIEYRIGDLNGYEDVATLYRQMKTALDNTKDYQQASWFYFNEFEMKRRALKENHAKTLQKKVLISETSFNLMAHYLRKFFSKSSLYYVYKTFAGYGEKPLWSLLWLGICAAIFTVMNLLSGIRISVDDAVKSVDYDISLTAQGFSTLLDLQFWSHLGNAVVFTLYRVIPVGYLPFYRSKFEPIGLDGLFLSFVNSVVLILLVVFIAIGLKRHFRRF